MAKHLDDVIGGLMCGAAAAGEAALVLGVAALAMFLLAGVLSLVAPS